MNVKRAQIKVVVKMGSETIVEEKKIEEARALVFGSPYIAVYKKKPKSPPA